MARYVHRARAIASACFVPRQASAGPARGRRARSDPRSHLASSRSSWRWPRRYRHPRGPPDERVVAGLRQDSVAVGDVSGPLAIEGQAASREDTGRGTADAFEHAAPLHQSGNSHRVGFMPPVNSRRTRIAAPDIAVAVGRAPRWLDRYLDRRRGGLARPATRPSKRTGASRVSMSEMRFRRASVPTTRPRSIRTSPRRRSTPTSAVPPRGIGSADGLEVLLQRATSSVPASTNMTSSASIWRCHVSQYRAGAGFPIRLRPNGNATSCVWRQRRCRVRASRDDIGPADRRC